MTLSPTVTAAPTPPTAEPAAIASDATFRAMAEAMPQLVWSARPDGSIDYFNERWYAYTGMARPVQPGDDGPDRDAHGWRWSEYLHPDDRARTLERWRQSLATGTPYEVECRFREAASGQYRWFLGRAVPLRDDLSAIVRWFGTCTDVEDAKRASLALAAEVAARDAALVALGESEARYRALAEVSPQIVWFGDASGTITECNPYWYAYTGLDVDESLGDGWTRAIHPDDRARMLQVWAAAVADAAADGMGRYEVEIRIRGARSSLADGTLPGDGYRWFLARGTAIRDAEGRVERWIGIAVDIHAIKQADARVAAERALLDAVLQQLPVGVVLGEAPDGRIVYGNRRAEEIFRHPVLPSPDVDSYREWIAYHPDGRQVQGREYPLARVLATGEATTGDEYLYRRGDGTDAWVRITGAPVRNGADAGVLTGAVVVIQDIDRERRTRDEREQLVQALSTERAKLDRLLTEAPAVMAIFSGPDHVITYVNPTWERTMGKPGAVGRPFREVFPELEGSGLLQHLDATYTDGVPYINPETLVPLQRWDRPVEQTFWDIVWQPMPGESALGREILVHAVEITAQVRARREAERLRREAESARADAERANRAKSEFLANMSHELRTPLNAIGGYAELLALGLHGPVSEPQREVLQRIQRSQEHLLGIITSILNFTRLEAGTIEYRLAAVPLADVVRETCALMEPLVVARGLASTVAPASEQDAGVVACADRDKLVQVLLNLLSNASKFTDAGGHIDVTWGNAPNAPDGTPLVYVRVRDTGRGIPADKRAAVFEPFVQVDGGRTRQHEGTGLGLSIARDLARGMQGELTLESELGVGSTFTLVLPRA